MELFIYLQVRGEKWRLKEMKKSLKIKSVSVVVRTTTRARGCLFQGLSTLPCFHSLGKDLLLHIMYQAQGLED